MHTRLVEMRPYKSGGGKAKVVCMHNFFARPTKDTNSRQVPHKLKAARIRKKEGPSTSGPRNRERHSMRKSLNVVAIFLMIMAIIIILVERFTVRSSLKQGIPKSLIVPSCNLELQDIIGQGIHCFAVATTRSPHIAQVNLELCTKLDRKNGLWMLQVKL